MKIIHTADLHLGQVIYQSYDRVDEHAYFFGQLKRWCYQEQPDALLVCGDVFDIQQPSAATKKMFNDTFADLVSSFPMMKVVIVGGNHDSASRLQADNAVWELSNARLVGTPPSGQLSASDDGWQERYIVRLDSGYIVALPFMSGDHQEAIQSILDCVNQENVHGKPVVLTGHLAVTGMDALGHPFEIGTVKTIDVATMGEGYDYLALGHIHKPQTLLHPSDCMKDDVTYPSGVARYSGSALHVSCDENYPHTVSVVHIDKHGGRVNIRQLRIHELRHFYTLPEEGPAFTTEDEVLKGVTEFCRTHASGYIRFRVNHDATLSSNFHQKVYDLLKQCDDEVRYNPKIIWEGIPSACYTVLDTPAFEVAELQQMASPLTFIEETIDQYPGLDMVILREAFSEVEAYILKNMND